MTDVAIAAVQYAYRCPSPGCPNTFRSSRIRCAEHISDCEYVELITATASLELQWMLRHFLAIPKGLA